VTSSYQRRNLLCDKDLVSKQECARCEYDLRATLTVSLSSHLRIILRA
jgi:hypothetical protein